MITAVDTNVVLDVFTADPRHGPASRSALADCIDDGRVVVCGVVWAEVSAGFGTPAEAEAALVRIGAVFSPMTAGAASLAGATWRRYRRAGGTRELLVADFLIGAHASVAADRLLTRDRGFYRSYFEELEILDPSSS